MHLSGEESGGGRMMIKATRYSPMLGTCTLQKNSPNWTVAFPAGLGFFEKVPYCGTELADMTVDLSGNGKVDESRIFGVKRRGSNFQSYKLFNP